MPFWGERPGTPGHGRSRRIRRSPHRKRRQLLQQRVRRLRSRRRHKPHPRRPSRGTQHSLVAAQHRGRRPRLGRPPRLGRLPRLESQRRHGGGRRPRRLHRQIPPLRGTRSRYVSGRLRRLRIFCRRSRRTRRTGRRRHRPRRPHMAPRRNHPARRAVGLRTAMHLRTAVHLGSVVRTGMALRLDRAPRMAQRPDRPRLPRPMRPLDRPRHRRGRFDPLSHRGRRLERPRDRARRVGGRESLHIVAGLNPRKRRLATGPPRRPQFRPSTASRSRWPLGLWGLKWHRAWPPLPTPTRCRFTAGP
jgi:hypothetical protein